MSEKFDGKNNPYVRLKDGQSVYYTIYDLTHALTCVREKLNIERQKNLGSCAYLNASEQEIGILKLLEFLIFKELEALQNKS